MPGNGKAFRGANELLLDSIFSRDEAFEMDRETERLPPTEERGVDKVPQSKIATPEAATACVAHAEEYFNKTDRTDSDFRDSDAMN